MIEVVLVDDQQLFLDSLLIVFESRAQDMRVVGTAKNGLDAIKAVEALRPDVVVLDVRMPVMDGVKCAESIHRLFPMIQIMMLTTFDDDEYVHQALSNGATGYMLKDIPPEELLAAIRAIHSGAVSISPSIMNKLIGKTLMPKTTHAALLADKPPDPTDDEPIEELTEREIGILELIGSGYQNKQIAEKLCLAEQTVKNYISVIYQKIFVSNRFEAIQFINGFKAYRNRPNSLPDTNGPMRKLP